MHPSVSLLSGLRTHLRDVNADIRGHHVRKSLLMSEVLASNEWTLFTQAAFSALQCYFWIFLIMSQHKFGYIIIMYSGVLASARLCLLYPDHSHHWRLSSAAYYKMPQISQVEFHQLTWHHSAHQTKVPVSVCAHVWKNVFSFGCHILMTYALKLICITVIANSRIPVDVQINSVHLFTLARIVCFMCFNTALLHMFKDSFGCVLEKGCVEHSVRHNCCNSIVM